MVSGATWLVVYKTWVVATEKHLELHDLYEIPREAFLGLYEEDVTKLER